MAVDRRSAPTRAGRPHAFAGRRTGVHRLLAVRLLAVRVCAMRADR
jgi:hypothetical protein